MKKITAFIAAAILAISLYPSFVDAGGKGGGYSSKGYSPKGYSPKGYSPKDYSPKDYSPKDYSPKDYSPKDYSPKGYSPKDYSPKDYSPKINSPKVYFPKVYSPEGDFGTYKSTGLPKTDRSKSAKDEFLRMQGYKNVPQGYEVDHIVPLHKGGADAPYNMQLLPKELHQQKTNTER